MRRIQMAVYALIGTLIGCEAAAPTGPRTASDTAREASVRIAANGDPVTKRKKSRKKKTKKKVRGTTIVVDNLPDGTCPEPFEAVPAAFAPDAPDRNGDGVLCYRQVPAKKKKVR